MARKRPPNAGKAWDTAETCKLRKLVKGNTPTRIIALRLGRTEAAIYGKCVRLGISLGPWNQPSRRRKRQR